MINLKNKIELGFFPTPIQELKNYSEKFSNYRIYIKRDDQTGLATGGNKTRKLEYLIKDAIDKRCNVVITAGAQQSNHCRQTAAACAQAGLKCYLLLGGTEPNIYNGNLLISKMLGAEILFNSEQRKGENIEIIFDDLQKKGLKPYIIPYGGSNITGVLGYINAVKEIKEQSKFMKVDFDYVFFASSSGGTYSGLLIGSEIFNFQAELMPINIDKKEILGRKQNEIVKDLVNEGCDLFNLESSKIIKKIHIINDYDSPGYGNLTDEERLCILDLAKTEGILLDPVYTGRAFYGMKDILKQHKIKSGSNILFLHTGGITANFEYADKMYNKI